MYRINQIKLSLTENEKELPEKVLKKLRCKDLKLKEWKISRESIDARDKSDIKRVFSIEFEIAENFSDKDSANMDSIKKRIEKAGAEFFVPEEYRLPQECGSFSERNEERPVVVGFGPGGIFAALILAQAGARPIVIERGCDVDKRAEDVRIFWETGKLDTESNVQFGEGGAGAFSDGKLTTGIKDLRIRKVLEELVRFGAPEEILYRQKPHVGTDLLRGTVKNIREEIIRLGGEVRFSIKMVGIVTDGERLRALRLADMAAGAEEYEIPCSKAIVAIGHSARDTFRMLNDFGIKMEQKPFSIGVRIEHPQDLIDTAQYGRPGRELGLPPAEYKLSYRCREEDGRGVYSFCMCPGGEVITASSEEGGVVVNGMSMYARDSGKANSALLCDVRTKDFGSDDVLAGVLFQEKYERLAFRLAGGRYAPPAATWGALRDGKAPHVEGCLPDFAVAALRRAMPEFGRKIKGFDADDAKVYAVETRSSSPVRILRGKDCQSLSLKGIYPCGEGAGYAGGITSAAVDGIKTAEAVLRAE